MEKIDIAIIGAGVVGLAIARELSRSSDKSIVVIERNQKFGLETSSRNSEVIHSGIYNPTDMLKTSLCHEGNALLYEFCDQYKVRYLKSGKLIIKNRKDKDEQFYHLLKQAQANEVDVELLNANKVAMLEPYIRAEQAILVLSTGILDTYEFMRRLHYLARQNGVNFLFNSAVKGLAYDGRGYIIETAVEQIAAEVLINSAGLNASDVPAMLGMDIDQLAYRVFPCKGEYFKINKRMAISHLLYPLPGPLGLGIHLTRDLEGGLRLGPNAYYVEELDYSLLEEHRQAFYQAASHYLPSLRIADISPDYAGIRPKLQGPNDVNPRDFVIQAEGQHGFPGLVNLIGIESPGLTASLAIGKYVKTLI